MYLYHAQKLQIIKIKLVSSVIFMTEDLFFICLIHTVPKNSPIMQEDGQFFPKGTPDTTGHKPRTLCWFQGCLAFMETQRKEGVGSFLGSRWELELPCLLPSLVQSSELTLSLVAVRLSVVSFFICVIEVHSTFQLCCATTFQGSAAENQI